VEALEVPSLQAKVELMHTIIEDDYILRLVKLWKVVRDTPRKEEYMPKMAVIFSKICTLLPPPPLSFIYSSSLPSFYPLRATPFEYILRLGSPRNYGSHI
jgi:hypothetical protein